MNADDRLRQLHPTAPLPPPVPPRRSPPAHVQPPPRPKVTQSRNRESAKPPSDPVAAVDRFVVRHIWRLAIGLIVAALVVVTMIVGLLAKPQREPAPLSPATVAEQAGPSSSSDFFFCHMLVFGPPRPEGADMKWGSGPEGLETVGLALTQLGFEPVTVTTRKVVVLDPTTGTIATIESAPDGRNWFELVLPKEVWGPRPETCPERLAVLLHTIGMMSDVAPSLIILVANQAANRQDPDGFAVWGRNIGARLSGDDIVISISYDLRDEPESAESAER